MISEYRFAQVLRIALLKFWNFVQKQKISKNIWIRVCVALLRREQLVQLTCDIQHKLWFKRVIGNIGRIDSWFVTCWLIEMRCTVVNVTMSRGICFYCESRFDLATSRCDDVLLNDVDSVTNSDPLPRHHWSPRSYVDNGAFQLNRVTFQNDIGTGCIDYVWFTDRIWFCNVFDIDQKSWKLIVNKKQANRKPWKTEIIRIGGRNCVSLASQLWNCDWASMPFNKYLHQL